MLDIKTTIVRDYLIKSRLPEADYVINPYIGCPHACLYCYAEFMKRFNNHAEAWGEFLEVKQCSRHIDLLKLQGKRVVISSVTDPYNGFECQYEVTRKILQQLLYSRAQISIITKSDLVLRDVDLLQKMQQVQVACSVNTLELEMQQIFEPAAPSIERRLMALQQLHQQGIHTVLFMSPIFPELTDWRRIMEETRNYVDMYWLENLNLRSGYKTKVLQVIAEHYPRQLPLYQRIYQHQEESYWDQLSQEVTDYCQVQQVPYKNYFHHGSVMAMA